MGRRGPTAVADRNEHDMSELSLGEVARRAGITASAIRYYEMEGLIPKPRRRSGRRAYDADVLDRLALIDVAKRAGFTVAETRQLLGGFTKKTTPGQRWRSLAKAKLRELDGRIAEAEQMRDVLALLVGCECPTLDDCAAVLRDKRRAVFSRPASRSSRRA